MGTGDATAGWSRDALPPIASPGTTRSLAKARESVLRLANHVQNDKLSTDHSPGVPDKEAICWYQLAGAWLAI